MIIQGISVSYLLIDVFSLNKEQLQQVGFQESRAALHPVQLQPDTESIGISVTPLHTARTIPVTRLDQIIHRD